jgi:hypothetical protein
LTVIDLTGPSPDGARDDLSDNAHRQLIGYIGLALPVLLYLLAGARPTTGLERWNVLGSISAYFYTGAVAAFVGMLVALALFLLTYRGYANRYQRFDRIAAIIAGIAALAVAFFPTGAPIPDLEVSWWSPGSAVIHYVAAIVLFGSFAFFSLFLFRLGSDRSPPDKRRQNTIFLVCGLTIVAAMIWAGFNGWTKKSIFVPESVALTAFAFSWLVKGRAHKSIASAVKAVSKSAE